MQQQQRGPARKTFNKGPRGAERKRPGGGSGEGRSFQGGAPRFFQKKTCRFCAERSILIDYKDSEKMKKYLTEKGKIIPRRITGNCAKCQRALTRAIKRCRHSGLVAFQID